MQLKQWKKLDVIDQIIQFSSEKLRNSFSILTSAKSTNLTRRQGKSPSLGGDSLKKVDVLKLVSQKISSNVTWLIDNNLPPLMEHSSAERNFVKLDNVFAVSIYVEIDRFLQVFVTITRFLLFTLHL